MTDTINEQISAFVDGELPDAERELLQKRLAADDELRSTWQRYHLIRDAIREDLPEFINKGNDMTYMQDDSDVSSVRSSVSLSQRFIRPLAGMAIAASVAVIAVVGVLYNGDQLAPQALPQIAVSPASTVSMPDNYRIVPRSGWKSAKPAVVSYLNGYLVDHSSYAGFGSAQGIIPYSRIAGYDVPMLDEKLKENADKEDKNQQ